MALNWNTLFNRSSNYVEQAQPALTNSPQEDTFLQLFRQLLAPQQKATATPQMDFAKLIQALREPEPTPHYGMGGALITAQNPTGNRSSLTPEDEWRKMFPHY